MSEVPMYLNINGQITQAVPDAAQGGVRAARQPHRPRRLDGHPRTPNPQPSTIYGGGGGHSRALSLSRVLRHCVLALPLSLSLHPTPYILHTSLYTLHPTPYTQHPTPCTLHPTPHTLHHTPYTLPGTRQPHRPRRLDGQPHTTGG